MNYWIEIPVPRTTLAEAGFGPASIPDDPHCTVLYFGKLKEPQVYDLRKILTNSSACNTFKATLNGSGEFLFGMRHLPVVLVDSAELIRHRTSIDLACLSLGIAADRKHGYQPHVTMAGLQRIRRAAVWTVDHFVLCSKEKGQPQTHEVFSLLGDVRGAAL